METIFKLLENIVHSTGGYLISMFIYFFLGLAHLSALSNLSNHMANPLKSTYYYPFVRAPSLGCLLRIRIPMNAKLHQGWEYLH